MTTHLTESQLIGLANIVDIIEQIDPNFSGATIAAYADIARTGRRHNGIMPSEAMGYCVRTVERYGLIWTRDRGWVVPASAQRTATAAAADAITDDEIRALRLEAIEHDDIVQRILCDVALTGIDGQYPDGYAAEPDSLDADGYPDYSGGGHGPGTLRSIREALRMTQAQARAECARVIAERAQAVRS